MLHHTYDASYILSAVCPVKLVGPGSHDEIILMQPFHFMGPPGDSHFAPFGQQSRVVIVLLSNLPYLVGEIQRLCKIFEGKHTPDALFACFGDELPIWNLLMVTRYLIGG